MRITVLLFGGAAQIAGADRVDIEAGQNPRSADVLGAIGRQLPALAPLLGVSRLAVNHEFATAEQEIHEGDEVALIAMVSGG